MSNGKHTNKTSFKMTPLSSWNFSKYKNYKKFGQDSVPIFVFYQNFLEVILLWTWFTTPKKWQSLYETNKESKRFSCVKQQLTTLFNMQFWLKFLATSVLRFTNLPHPTSSPRFIRLINLAIHRPFYTRIWKTFSWFTLYVRFSDFCQNFWLLSEFLTFVRFSDITSF